MMKLKRKEEKMAEQFLEQEAERRLAINLFNHVWTLMDLLERDQTQIDEMIHAVHASRYHWGNVGTVLESARGEWQISRVYAVLGRAEPALYHARRTLQLCLENGIGDFDLAFAYEAMARALKIDARGEAPESAHYLSLAYQAADNIKEAEDRQIILDDLATLAD